MITGTFVLIALVLGYGVAVGVWMLATFGITKAAPAFVASDHHLRSGYRFVQELVWLVCAVIGGYVAAWVAEPGGHPWLAGVLLVATMVGVLWGNTWEVAQRGLGHQLVMSIVTVIGVGAGFVLRLR